MGHPAWKKRKYPACVRLCAWCQQLRPMRAGCMYCSRPCAAHGGTLRLSEEALSARGRKAAAASRVKRRAAAEARVEGLTPLEAYRLGYRNGLCAFRSRLAVKRRELRRQKGRAA